jgi:aspartyl-tRNA(Asn)/glutamyl-tRNA(Gln) amidotransferase subunit C
MKPPSFTRAEVDHLATLAALTLGDGEADAMAKELAKIVAYVQELASVDTADVEAERPLAAAWREDVLLPGLSRDELLAAAPRTAEGGFSVPAFVSTTTATGVSRRGQ